MSDDSRRAMAQAIHRALFKWTTPREDGSVEAIEHVLQAHHEAEVATCPNCGCDYQTAGELRHWKDGDEVAALREQVAQLTEALVKTEAVLTEWLTVGGFWNPELMDAAALGQAVLHLRDELSILRRVEAR